ncbi:MAG: hypothetical protein QOF89_4168 [Acidobacteriota bacterium]|jgi:hypothetical protein|nr:hypothetical protein [Acidobacteriota bacterium]
MKQEPQDDTLLRSYLLGELREEETDRLEQRLLQEDELFELAEAVEADLLAAAGRGDLTPAERERVLRRLASSPQGRERLAFARSLNAVTAEQGLEGTGAGNGAAPVLPFSHRARTFPPPAVYWMALAASLVLLTGLSWFAWQNRTQAREAASRMAQTPTPVPILQPHVPPAQAVPMPRAVNPPAQGTPHPAPDHRMPREEISPASIPAVLTLSLMGSRGAERVERLHLLPGTRTAEIRIDVEGQDDAPSFHVVLRRDNETVWEKSALKPSALRWGQGLVVDVPAERLSAGRYEIAVTPQGSEEVAIEFEVVEGKR